MSTLIGLSLLACPGTSDLPDPPPPRPARPVQDDSATDSTTEDDSPTPRPRPEERGYDRTTRLGPASVPEPEVRFAMIGDAGSGDHNAAAVSDLVHGWGVDFVITVGDNNYPGGEAETIDEKIGQFWHDFIHPYLGEYGEGAEENRFWPALGNHDWNPEIGVDAHTDYFELPGNERYYDLVRGPVHLFCIDSDIHEPDSMYADGVQAQWLEEVLTDSTAPWKLVYQHHPPYSSGHYGPDVNRQWPHAEWGVDVLMAGHEHDYERLHVDGVTHVIGGIGGVATRPLRELYDGSQVAWSARHGAVLVELSETWGTFSALDTLGAIGDRWHAAPGVDPADAAVVFARESTWHFDLPAQTPPDDWTEDDYDDSDWSTGVAPMGDGEHMKTELEGIGGLTTLYMRSSFPLSDVEDVRYLVLRLRRDDGAVVYLNGEEVYRVGLATEPLTVDTPAAFLVEMDWEQVYSETLLWPTGLREGRNQLAVEVHRFGSSDPDVFADLELAVLRR